MGNTHIKGWQMFLIAGFLAGAISGILLVANQRGKVAKIKATDTPPEFAGFVPWLESGTSTTFRFRSPRASW